MPTAALIDRKRNKKGKPAGVRSITKLGITFEPGVEHEVDADTASILSDDRRFIVSGLHTAAVTGGPDGKVAENHLEPGDGKGRPKTAKAVTNQILKAADEVDEEDDTKWEADGSKPTAAALTEILGYEVTPEEVQTAYGTEAPATGTPGAPGSNPVDTPPAKPAETEAPKKGKSRVTIKRKPADEPNPATTGKTTETDKPTDNGKDTGSDQKTGQTTGDGDANGSGGDINTDTDNGRAIEI